MPAKRTSAVAAFILDGVVAIIVGLGTYWLQEWALTNVEMGASEFGDALAGAGVLMSPVFITGWIAALVWITVAFLLARKFRSLGAQKRKKAT